MTNEELKNKIMEIIDASCSFYSGSSVHMDDEQEKAIADALIAAGIGDVKESENKATAAELVAQASASTAIEKIEEWKHRAKVAERALVMSCANMVKDEKSDVNIEQVIRVLYYKYLKQAENELTEERKDD